VSTPSKAAANRWLAGHVGATIDTVQVRPDGSTGWKPGPRTLAGTGNRFELNGSRVNIDRSTVVIEVTGDTLVLEWQDGDGATIHTTTYTVQDADLIGADDHPIRVGDRVDLFTDDKGPDPAGTYVTTATVVRLLPAEGVLFTDRYTDRGRDETVEFPACVRQAITREAQ
jgi:hypothetical protein